VVWIVRYAWDKSFICIDTNKDAITERGLGPLNYVLLDHPELQAIQDRVNMVNLHDGGDLYYRERGDRGGIRLILGRGTLV
jgi:hypothetical protein